MITSIYYYCSLSLSFPQTFATTNLVSVVLIEPRTRDKRKKDTKKIKLTRYFDFVLSVCLFCLVVCLFYYYLLLSV